MNKLETKYMGLTLSSPIIVASSGLTSSLENIIKAEEAGAGAVVLKSLFEEQINHEAGRSVDYSYSPEADDYMLTYLKANETNKYVNLIKEAKAKVNIPIIASINCIDSDEWITFASEFEKAGADALEVNIYNLALDKNAADGDVENTYYRLASKLRSVISIPISFKLGEHISNIPKLVSRLEAEGINGVVLFNRFYQMDIDIDKLEFKTSNLVSRPIEIRNSLKWVGILSGMTKVDIAASTGVHDGEAAIKQLLAGATTVQLCSILYKLGISSISSFNESITNWMDQKGFTSIDDFRGMLNYKTVGRPDVYERTQFMKYFSSFE